MLIYRKFDALASSDTDLFLSDEVLKQVHPFEIYVGLLHQLSKAYERMKDSGKLSTFCFMKPLI